jgi:hypothetical protein
MKGGCEMSENKKSPATPAGITVGDLRRQLEGYPDDAELFFGGLRFYRLKSRGEKLVQLEFQEQVYREQDGTLVAIDAN